MSNPIRVLHVIGKRPKGGIGTFLLNIHRNINTDNIQFDYLINADDNEGFFDKEVKKLGGKVYIMPELCYKNTFKYLIALNKFFKEHKEYNIIHGHSVNIGIFYFTIAKFYGVKFRIAHSHSTKYSDSKINSIRNFILQIPLKILVNNYFACSTEAAKFLFGDNNLNDVNIIRNPIDLDKFKYNENIREKLRADLNISDKLVIGHIGAFLPVKNHKMIVKIFSEIKKINPKSCLLLVGEGPLKDEIYKMVKELKIEDSVLFLGARTDVSNLLQAMDVFLLPSFFEGLPLVGIECQAAGVQSYLSENISREVSVCDVVKFLSIQDSPKYWAEEIITNREIYSHKDTYNDMVNAGFHVKDSVNMIERFYMNLK